MKHGIYAVLLLLVVPLASAEVFVTPFGGYSFGASGLDANLTRDNQSISGDIQAEESSHYGIMLGVLTRHPGNIYLLYSNQNTQLKSGGDFSNQRITSLQLDYAHLGGSLYFPVGDFHPYVSATAGLTQMRPGDDFSNETRFSMGLGIGAEYRLGDNLALLAEMRGFATFINGDNDVFCSADNCVWRIESDLMWQGQANLGLSFRF
ncbi:porin family protein [Shewanella cyperi]|uniref:Porin family protein n=1 Tax=Shewanella cyperi TaxID=2814292 RepID=A0A974XLN6_9GAMM|nr:outer membrane beta-barrel protein [Shewanella cyperi]QSX30697.1 porin family protein [Shewanella cyperi]